MEVVTIHLKYDNSTVANFKTVTLLVKINARNDNNSIDQFEFLNKFERSCKRYEKDIN